MITIKIYKFSPFVWFNCLVYHYHSPEGVYPPTPVDFDIIYFHGGGGVPSRKNCKCNSPPSWGGFFLEKGKNPRPKSEN